MEAVRHGLSNPEIAAQLGNSLDAVKYHVANALQKLGMSSRLQLRRWNGISRDSAMHDMAPSAGIEDALGTIGQISRQVKDIDASRHWFGEVLGLKHLYSFGKLAFFDCGGVRLFLSERTSENGGGYGDSIIYFRVVHILAAHAQLAARGIEFTHAPHRIHLHDDGTEEWLAFFRDNESRPLAIMAQVSAMPDR